LKNLFFTLDSIVVQPVHPLANEQWVKLTDVPTRSMTGGRGRAGAAIFLLVGILFAFGYGFKNGLLIPAGKKAAAAVGTFFSALTNSFRRIHRFSFGFHWLIALLASGPGVWYASREWKATGDTSLFIFALFITAV